MKITKEEKQLYKLLDVINKIFGKTSDRTIILGNHHSLYFYTLGYCGVFMSKDNDDTLVDAYDFGTYFYELKQLPNKSFVLDVLNYDADPDSQNLYYNTMEFIDGRIRERKWILDMHKDYDYKIAKISSSTKKWIRDDDIGYLKMFQHFDVMETDDSLIFKSNDDEYSDTCLIMTGSTVIPDYDDATQMKIDAYIKEDSQQGNDTEELPDEFEDEEDPMA